VTSSGAAASNTQAASATVTIIVGGDSHTGAIVGGVIGGVIVIVLILVGIVFVYRRGMMKGRTEAALGGVPNPKDQEKASGSVDQSANLQASTPMDSGNLGSEGNPDIEMPSHRLRYLDEERLGTAAD